MRAPTTPRLQAQLEELRAQVVEAKVANERCPRHSRLQRAGNPRPLHRPALARGRVAAQPRIATASSRSHGMPYRQGKWLCRLCALGR